MLRRLFRWLQPAFLIVAILVIGWFLANQWPLLRSYPWRLDWGWLVATFVLTLTSWGLEIAIWRYLLATLGASLDYSSAARIWFLSAIVRYIPGNVWQPLSMTLYNRRHGIAPETTLTSIVLFQVVSMLAIVPILIAYFLWIDSQSVVAHLVNQLPRVLIWGGMIPVLLFLWRPQWMVHLLNRGLIRLKRPPLALALTSRRLLWLVLLALLNWLLWGSVFAALAFGIAGNAFGANAHIAPLLVTAFPIASIVGLLSLFAPSGFGVREGVFFLLLTPQIAGSVVTVIALGVRVWGIANELLLALISAPFENAFVAKSAANSATMDAASNRRTELALPPDVPLCESIVANDLSRETL
jgi:glycosyltransferase 2 family protein